MLKFMRGFRALWGKDPANLEVWIAALEAGETPTMAPNCHSEYSYQF